MKDVLLMVRASCWNHPSQANIKRCSQFSPKVVLWFLQAISFVKSQGLRSLHIVPCWNTAYRYGGGVEWLPTRQYQSFGLCCFPVFATSNKTSSLSIIQGGKSRWQWPPLSFQLLLIKSHLLSVPETVGCSIPCQWMCLYRWAPATVHVLEHVAAFIITSISSRRDSPKCSHHLTVSLCTLCQQKGTQTL